VAFARRAGDGWVIAIAPRLCVSLVPAGTLPVGGVWRDTTLELPEGAPRSWIDALTGARVDSHERRLDLAVCLAALPMALFVPVGVD
jgi:maltooligosyltrehalose synthase